MTGDVGAGGTSGDRETGNADGGMGGANDGRAAEGERCG